MNGLASHNGRLSKADTNSSLGNIEMHLIIWHRAVITRADCRRLFCSQAQNHARSFIRVHSWYVLGSFVWDAVSLCNYLYSQKRKESTHYKNNNQPPIKPVRKKCNARLITVREWVQSGMCDTCSISDKQCVVIVVVGRFGPCERVICAISSRSSAVQHAIPFIIFHGAAFRVDGEATQNVV